jgi:ribosome-associated protein
LASKKTTKSTKGSKKKTDGGGDAVKKPTKKAKAKAKGTKADAAAKELALAIAAAALDKKALNVEIIDVRGKVDYADYVVVMSGRSDRQVNAIARGIEEHVKKTTGQNALGVEGLPQGTWVLMDFGDAVVHIFHEDTRGYYDLESLWIDAARIEIDERATA